MTRIMGMMPARFWRHGLECSQVIQIGVGIEVGSGNSRCGVLHKHVQQAVTVQQVGHLIGDINNIALLSRLNGKLHVHLLYAKQEIAKLANKL